MQSIALSPTTRRRSPSNFADSQRPFFPSEASEVWPGNGVTIVKATVESRKGAVSEPKGTDPFPLPAHQTGRVHFEHPAFRLVSPQHPREWSPQHGAGRRH